MHHNDIMGAYTFRDEMQRIPRHCDNALCPSSLGSRPEHTDNLAQTSDRLWWLRTRPDEVMHTLSWADSVSPEERERSGRMTYELQEKIIGYARVF